jgi:hypothetical protein
VSVAGLEDSTVVSKVQFGDGPLVVMVTESCFEHDDAPAPASGHAELPPPSLGGAAASFVTGTLPWSDIPLSAASLSGVTTPPSSSAGMQRGSENSPMRTNRHVCPRGQSESSLQASPTAPWRTLEVPLASALPSSLGGASALPHAITKRLALATVAHDRQ